MPTYVYRCDSCSNQFELVQRMADDPIDTCPACSSQVRRIIHPVGVVFKGSGWYINDSRSSNSTETSSSNGTSKDAKPEPATPNGTDAAKKTPEKPAAKTAAD